MNICKECRWVENVSVVTYQGENVVHEKANFCLSPDNIDPVSGKKKRVVRCRDARKIDGFCGPKGDYWEGA